MDIATPVPADFVVEMFTCRNDPLSGMEACVLSSWETSSDGLTLMNIVFDSQSQIPELTCTRRPSEALDTELFFHYASKKTMLSDAFDINWTVLEPFDDERENETGYSSDTRGTESRMIGPYYPEVIYDNWPFNEYTWDSTISEDSLAFRQGWAGTMRMGLYYGTGEDTHMCAYETL